MAKLPGDDTNQQIADNKGLTFNSTRLNKVKSMKTYYPFLRAVCIFFLACTVIFRSFALVDYGYRDIAIATRVADVIGYS